jgi:hypothetical protein
MKRAAFIFAGALAFAAAGFAVGSLLTQWYADTLAGSQDDIDDAVTLAAAALPILLALGGYVGHRVHRRRSAKE